MFSKYVRSSEIFQGSIIYRDLLVSNRNEKRVLAYLNMAKILGSLSTCPRGQVGCIITDSSGMILSTGYNGLPAGHPHCSEKVSSRACRAVHAEQNALIQCRSIKEAKHIYVSMTPCQHCMKMLANTPITCIWFSKEYRDTKPLEWWLDIGREAYCVDLSDATVKP